MARRSSKVTSETRVSLTPLNLRPPRPGVKGGLWRAGVGLDPDVVLALRVPELEHHRLAAALGRDRGEPGDPERQGEAGKGKTPGVASGGLLVGTSRSC